MKKRNKMTKNGSGCLTKLKTTSWELISNHHQKSWGKTRTKLIRTFILRRDNLLGITIFRNWLSKIHCSFRVVRLRIEILQIFKRIKVICMLLRRTRCTILRSILRTSIILMSKLKTKILDQEWFIKGVILMRTPIRIQVTKLNYYFFI